MGNSKENKAREKRYIELFKGVHKGFPSGTILADENQERPDIIVVTSQEKIGIEITALHNDKLKREESECEKTVLESQRIYEKYNLPALYVYVTIANRDSFNRKNRSTFASAITKLVVANIPSENTYVVLENDNNNPAQFPYEIDSIGIYRHTLNEGNNWSTTSAGLYRENFIDELQSVISDKDSKFSGYARDCKEQWLLIIAENSSPSTFFDPSEKTATHCYKSSFNKVFLLKLDGTFFELKLIQNA